MTISKALRQSLGGPWTILRERRKKTLKSPFTVFKKSSESPQEILRVPKKLSKILYKVIGKNVYHLLSTVYNLLYTVKNLTWSY